MVRELHELQEELRTSAAMDALTGAFNRKKIEQLLEWELERATRYNGTLSLILFDLDHFKIVNDTYGHLSGDYVLKTVIRIIQDHIRKTDSLGRWGGEEFMLLAPETCMEQAAELAEKIRQHVELFTYKDVGTVTISCGLAELKVGDTIDSLIKRADDALYKAKRKGRNRVEADEHLVLI
jgi:diguanylate cyclase (GGDEF)-like protein